MHGLVFVTWENYLSERFGFPLLSRYRAALGETPINTPLASQVYTDEALITGIEQAGRLTGLSIDHLLHEYGRYFITNGLTSHRCAYILSQVHTGPDLVLSMREAHAQMHRAIDRVTPPIFSYEVLPGSDNRSIRLTYESPRQLCPLLMGSIEGAAQRYNEKVTIVERTCMRRGADACRFDLRFSSPDGVNTQTPQQKASQRRQQQRANLILRILPPTDGVTWIELQHQLQNMEVAHAFLRPYALIETLQHLQHAGLVTSTAHTGDILDRRRYWRTPIIQH